MRNPEQMVLAETPHEKAIREGFFKGRKTLQTVPSNLGGW
jgi:hypothetical protein